MLGKVIALFSSSLLGGCIFLSGFLSPLVCGDGILTPEREECEDGNTQNGDGCDAGCVIEAVDQTIVVNSINIPDNDAEAATFAEDFNQDGVINDADNALADVREVFFSAGLDIEDRLSDFSEFGRFSYGFDIVASGGVAEVFDGYRAQINGGDAFPAYDGSDAVTPLGGVTSFEVELIGDLFQAEASLFTFVSFSSMLAEFLFASELPLQNAVIRTTLSGGSLSGTLDRFDMAQDMERLAALINNEVQAEASGFNGGGAPQTCGFGAACIDLDGADNGACTDQSNDGVDTGVCILDPFFGLRTFALLNAFDANRNGTVEIDFDPVAQSFVANDGALVFDLSNSAPVGLLGEAFRLDLDGDGTNDSMGIGVGFTAVNANRE